MAQLAGVRVLVTRPPGQASALADLIQAAGGEPWEVPVIAIVQPESWAPLDAAIRQIGEYRWLLFTSVNGVEAFAGRLGVVAAPPAVPTHLRIAVVGAATGRAVAAQLGREPDAVPGEYRGAALPAALAPHLAPGDRVLMARAERADPALAEALSGLGAQVDDVVAYRTVLARTDMTPVREALSRGEIQYVTFTSGSGVEGLLERLGGPAALAGPAAAGGPRIACIGPETTKAATAAGLTVHVVATQATLAALVEAIVQDSVHLKEELHS